MPITGEFM